MTEHKFTDGEIIRDLLRCANKDVSFCKECRHRNYSDGCCIQLMKDALDLISRQRAEIERLKKIGDDKTSEVMRHDASIRELHKQLETAKAEAIKEFAERLKKKAQPYEVTTAYADGEEIRAVEIDEIDNLVKEMTEEKTKT